MLPTDRVVKLPNRNPKKPIIRTIIFSVLGIFLALFVIGMIINIIDEKNSGTKDNERAQENEEVNANDQEYIEWFEEHNSSFHTRLNDYEKSVQEDWNAIPETRETLSQSLREARGQEISNSHFDKLHGDYQQAMYKVEAALNEKPDSEEQNELLEEAKVLEAKAVEDFNERKESVNADH
ncbi:hypothetical protein [Peribacillus frigoritolerans]|uniref:hypothetical protein n=1 Tax=Peribacillus frigoritolerans TaxID=450367 RepID=UPI00380318D7